MTPDQQNTAGRWMFVPDGWQVVPPPELREMTTRELARAIKPIIESVCSDGNSDADQVARECARAVLRLVASPSPPEVREVTEAMIARAICCLGEPCMGRGDKGACIADAGLYAGEVAAVLRLIAPSDQDVTRK